MEKELLKIFILEMKIDNKLNEVIKITNETYNYFDNRNSDLDEEDIMNMLEDIEYIIKDVNSLLDKLAKKYEEYYIK